MPHGRDALIDQLRALPTDQRYSSIVVHKLLPECRHFLENLARREIAVEAATAAQVSQLSPYAIRRFRQRHGHPHRRDGNSFPGQESCAAAPRA
jgi:integrase/recombinase XerD